MTDRLPPLATRANERLIANPSRLGGIDRIVSSKPDAWQLELPDLGSLPKGEGPRRNIRICIATEDIVGPVRNGGIGTTYAALAELLAGEGHDTTVLYLGGTRVENETAEHWIHVYAEKGVKLVPVPNYAASEHVSAGAPQWFAPMYNMYRYLSEHPFDVVHVSEWRGSAYLSLLAKRQGLGLQDTLFIVKTSSPWLWNRLYGSLPLEQAPELAKTIAERRSVELADMVVGGSLHLIRWMETQGYDVPRRRSYVQPNVVRFDHLRGLMGKRAHAPGARRSLAGVYADDGNRGSCKTAVVRFQQVRLFGGVHRLRIEGGGDGPADALLQPSHGPAGGMGLDGDWPGPDSRRDFGPYHRPGIRHVALEVGPASPLHVRGRHTLRSCRLGTAESASRLGSRQPVYVHDHLHHRGARVRCDVRDSQFCPVA